MQIKRKSLITIFFSYGWIFILPMLVMVPVMYQVIGIAGALAGFAIPVVVAGLNLLLRGVTDHITITEDSVVISKMGGKEVEHTLAGLDVSEIKSRNWWRGFEFASEAGVTRIWKHEFDRAAWEAICARSTAVSDAR